MNVHRIAALVLGSLAAGACVTDPTEFLASLPGTWVTRDTSEIRYQGADGLPHIFSYVNTYGVSITAVNDTTLSFRVIGGTQTQLDSIVGVGSGRDTVTGVELAGIIRIRGDTAFIEQLGKLPLRSRDTRRLDSHRVMTEAECLDEVGPDLPHPPPPVCVQAHHWAR